MNPEQSLKIVPASDGNAAENQIGRDFRQQEAALPCLAGSL
jgi:hypothetical protein